MSHLLPLEGVRVIEICNVAAGPFCAVLLADMGADVIKLENPESGDTLRAWPPHTGPADDLLSENFASLNRNKRSISLDLKNEEQRAKARALIAKSDVLIENNRPGVMARLGMDFESLKIINPKLIYCSISAFGQSGPRSSEGGFDVTIQAMSGIMSVTGEANGAPVKCGVPVSDFTAGLYGAMAICAQLREVDKVGEGVHIDIPMMGTSLAIAALQTSEFFGSEKDPVKLGSAHPRNAPYQAFLAQDDYLVMAAGTQGLWESVCKLLNCRNLLLDERFTSSALRAKNQAALKELIESILAVHPAKYWIELLSKAGIPCCPINSYSEVIKDKQTHAMGWVHDLEMANSHKTKTIGSPIQFNGKISKIRLHPPRLGEHNKEILGE